MPSHDVRRDWMKRYDSAFLLQTSSSLFGLIHKPLILLDRISYAHSLVVISSIFCDTRRSRHFLCQLLVFPITSVIPHF